MTVHIGAFETAAIVVVLAALAAYLNRLTLKLPQTIALTLIGASAALAVAGIDAAWPSAGLSTTIESFLGNIDFKTALLNVMLSFLLFAGALHIDIRHLSRGKWLVAVLSTVGVIISTIVVAFGLRLLSGLVGLDIPMSWCLVFGALISPTDPVAVIALLHRSAAPDLMKTTVAAESLFNDGVGVVVFTIMLAAAAGGHTPTWLEAAHMFSVEAGGGVLLGLALGGVGFVLMRSIEDYATEALITVALVMGGYAIAVPLGVSGPVAMAVAGLIIGNWAVDQAMSEITRQHLMSFWDLIDQILNAALFLLIGLEGIVLIQQPGLLVMAVAVVPLVLFARAISIAPPLAIWRNMLNFRQALPLLTWGGLRGGICIAMALALPAGAVREAILAATYVVVMVSVLVQGLTVGPMIRRLFGPDPIAEEGHA